MSVEVKLNELSLIRAKIGSDAMFTAGLKQAGEDIVNLASQLAPKDTGALSQSGEVRVIDQNTVEVSFGNDLPDERAIAQEFGSPYTPAQPYFYPAIKEIDILFHVRENLGL